MSEKLSRGLEQALAKIDRPGAFCASGSVEPVLPGLEIQGVGQVGSGVSRPPGGDALTE